jgi:hypothetical protein
MKKYLLKYFTMFEINANAFQTGIKFKKIDELQQLVKNVNYIANPTNEKIKKFTLKMFPTPFNESWIVVYECVSDIFVLEENTIEYKYEIWDLSKLIIVSDDFLNVNDIKFKTFDNLFEKIQINRHCIQINLPHNKSNCCCTDHYINRFYGKDILTKPNIKCKIIEIKFNIFLSENNQICYFNNFIQRINLRTLNDNNE